MKKFLITPDNTVNVPDYERISSIDVMIPDEIKHFQYSIHDSCDNASYMRNKIIQYGGTIIELPITTENKRLCILFYGNTDNINDELEYHREMISFYEKLFIVTTFCVLDTRDNVESIIDAIKPNAVTYVDTFNHDIQTYVTTLSQGNPACQLSSSSGNSYSENLNIVSKYDALMTAKKDQPYITIDQLRQYLTIKNGIQLIEEYAKKNSIEYNFFVCTQFRYIIKNYCDFSIFNDEQHTYDDVVTCNNPIVKNAYEKARSIYGFKNTLDMLEFLKEMKIDKYAGQLYTEQSRVINFGGRYIKNYDTLEKIYTNTRDNASSNLNNIIYFNDDYAIQSAWKNIDVLKDFVASFGLHRTSETYGTNIFKSEYQLISFCNKHELLPIMYSGCVFGGLINNSVSVMNLGIIPNKNVIIRDVPCYHTDGTFTFDNVPKCSLTFEIPYGYYSEDVILTSSINTPTNLNMIMSVSDNKYNAVIANSFTVTSGKIELRYKVITNDKFYINVEFANITKLVISDINIKHLDIIITRVWREI